MMYRVRALLRSILFVFVALFSSPSLSADRHLPQATLGVLPANGPQRLSVPLALQTPPSGPNDDRYGAIVIDAATGATLFAERADVRLHPASTTKMMTLYLVFEALRQGRLHIDQKLTISRHAAAQTGSRLGLQAGDRVSLRDCLRATAIKSANDCAVALAEAVGGTEAAFAQLMTGKAAQMGLGATFFNASGLTHPQHRASPRDMAQIGLALWRDFPEFYPLFSRTDSEWRGRQYRTTNHLLGSYKGADGIKTGFTNPAGYNLVASADRDGQRIIAVVFGGRTARGRDAQMVKLLDYGFAKLADPKISRDSMPMTAASTAMPPASAKAVARRWRAQLVSADNGAALSAATVAALGQGKAAAVDAAQAESGRAPAGWAVQIGAFSSHDQAMNRLREVLNSERAALKTAFHAVDVAHLTSGVAYRARFTGFDEDSARAACRSLSIKSITCALVPPGGW